MIERIGLSASTLISVGMSVRNCEATLGVALQSIVQQTYPHWELWLLDDGSTDRTLDVARQFNDPRIRLITDGKKMGLAARLNQAAGLAQGQYFARMDGDDICYPERFERQVAMLGLRPDIDLLGCGAIVFNGSGQAVGKLPLRLDHAEICKRPWGGFYLAHPTWMGRTEWFKKYPYRQDALRAQDQDLLLRTHRHSHFAALPDILLGYRQESVSLSSVLRGRYYFSRALYRQTIEGRDWQLVRGLLEQPLKGLIDAFAVGTGLNYRLLRHRAMPIDEKVRAEWKKVWTAVVSTSLAIHPKLAIRSRV